MRTKNYKEFYLEQIDKILLPLFRKNKDTVEMKKILMDAQKYIRIVPKDKMSKEDIAEFIVEKIKEEFTIPTKMGDKKQNTLTNNMQIFMPAMKTAIIKYIEQIEEFTRELGKKDPRNMVKEAMIYAMGILKLKLFSPLNIST